MPRSRAPTVLSAMTPFPYAIEADETIVRAQQMMDEHGIHHLPVLRHGELAGIVSARDISLCVDVLGAPNAASSLPVWTVCARDPYVVEIDASLADVSDELGTRHIGSAIVTKHGKLAGILTITDVCCALARVLREQFGDDDHDDVA